MYAPERHRSWNDLGQDGSRNLRSRKPRRAAARSTSSRDPDTKRETHCQKTDDSDRGIGLQRHTTSLKRLLPFAFSLVYDATPIAEPTTGSVELDSISQSRSPQMN